MTKRSSQAERLAAALKANISAKAGSGRDDRNPADVVRTTLAAPASLIMELRHLALSTRCHMNDLVLLALQDFLRRLGSHHEVPVSAAVRDRLPAPSAEAEIPRT